MKVFVAISVLVACIATISSSPVAPKLVDWTAVAAKANELEDTVKNAGRDIMAMACRENAMVCSAMEMKIQMASTEASAIMDRANQAIAAQTLTEGQAGAMVGELRRVMGKLQGMIQGDIAMLMPVTAAEIRMTIDATYVAIAMREQEMFALLRQ